MEATALIRITSTDRESRPGYRSLLEATQWASSLPGFRRWQTFRLMDASGALMAVVDWGSREALDAAAADPWLQVLKARASRHGYTLGPLEVLSDPFDRRMLQKASAATLLRVSRRVSGQPGTSARDREFGMQALGAPGSVGLSGARSTAGGVSVCRIDFELEDGIWNFLDSPLRRAWSRPAVRGEEDEVWAINLPRFECRVPYGRDHAGCRRAPGEEPLSVRLAVDDSTRTARVRLEGHVDGHSSAQCERVCRSLMDGGCQVLELDLSELTAISTEALSMLTRTARYLKERGGEFVLIDNDTRVRRVTRTKHLEASLR